MKRLLLIVFALVSLAAQETRLPEGHFCMAGPPATNQPKGHECHCKFLCDVDEHGNITDRESPDCKLYCRRSSCTCHADEACQPPARG